MRNYYKNKSYYWEEDEQGGYKSNSYVSGYSGYIPIIDTSKPAKTKKFAKPKKRIKPVKPIKPTKPSKGPISIVFDEKTRTYRYE